MATLNASNTADSAYQRSVSLGNEDELANLAPIPRVDYSVSIAVVIRGHMHWLDTEREVQRPTPHDAP